MAAKSLKYLESNNRYSASRFGLMILCFCCCGFCAISCKFHDDPFSKKEFSQQEWLVGEPRERALMTRSAMTKLSPGMAEDDIPKLLGDPHEIIETRKLCRVCATVPESAFRTYTYYLGCWSEDYYDSTFLWIHIDKDGKILMSVIGGG